MMTDTTHKAPERIWATMMDSECARSGTFVDLKEYPTKPNHDAAVYVRADLVQQDDDDFYPASAGDDPIWLGGVEYITRQRSDDLVQAERERCARVAETEGVAPWTNTNQPDDSWYKHGQRIAAAIREGGK